MIYYIYYSLILLYLQVRPCRNARRGISCRIFIQVRILQTSKQNSSIFRTRWKNVSARCIMWSFHNLMKLYTVHSFKYKQNLGATLEQLRDVSMRRWRPQYQQTKGLIINIGRLNYLLSGLSSFHLWFERPQLNIKQSPII